MGTNFEIIILTRDIEFNTGNRCGISKFSFGLPAFWWLKLQDSFVSGNNIVGEVETSHFGHFTDSGVILAGLKTVTIQLGKLGQGKLEHIGNQIEPRSRNV